MLDGSQKRRNLEVKLPKLWKVMREVLRCCRDYELTVSLTQLSILSLSSISIIEEFRSTVSVENARRGQGCLEPGRDRGSGEV